MTTKKNILTGFWWIFGRRVPISTGILGVEFGLWEQISALWDHFWEVHRSISWEVISRYLAKKVKSAGGYIPHMSPKSFQTWSGWLPELVFGILAILGIFEFFVGPNGSSENGYARCLGLAPSRNHGKSCKIVYFFSKALKNRPKISRTDPKVIANHFA